MKSDPFFGGQTAYANCRGAVISDQRGLCAYCEIDIRDNNPLNCRVEHFHPKSDITPNHNWSLDWSNLLGVCMGGTMKYANVAGHYLAPLSRNLSCDAHKDQMIQTHKLPQVCEGWILNPLQIPAMATLFKLDKFNGELSAEIEQCKQLVINGNQHATTASLVQHTIDMLNLNCDRLATRRLLIVREIERYKIKLRKQNIPPSKGLNLLSQRYFQTVWPEFFTTLRLCIGPAVDMHLQSLTYQG
jgi:uncharacterized protein (TIGR02646 family)